MPAGKIKVGKRISYRFQCSTACQVTASSTLVLKGPNLGPAVDTGIFSAGEIGLEFLTLNKAARFAIKSNLGSLQAAHLDHRQRRRRRDGHRHASLPVQALGALAGGDFTLNGLSSRRREK